jgi:mannosyltransferase
VAVIGSLFLALNEYHIAYSQEARGYSLVVLFSIVSTLFFVRAVEEDRRTDWVFYVVASTLACYSQIFALLVFAAQWGSLLVVLPRSTQRRGFLASAAAIVLFSLPLVQNVLKAGSHLGWIAHPTATDLYSMLCEYAAMRQGYRLLAFGLFAACLAAMIFAVRDWKRPESKFWTWHFVLLLSWFILPISLTFLVSQWKPAFADRFLIVCLPALLMLAALGISRIPYKLITFACVLTLVTWQIRCIRTYELKLAKEDWRGATAYLIGNRTPVDGLIFYKPFCQMNFDYYARLQNRAGALVAVPPFETGAWRANAEWLTASGSQASHRPARVWLVESHQGSSRDIGAIERDLSALYTNVSEQDFRGIRILLYLSNHR